MPSIRELEDLIIDAIYLDVLRGKLDQSKELFEVEYTMGRDLEPGKLESILVALQNWYVALVVIVPWGITFPFLLQGGNNIVGTCHAR